MIARKPLETAYWKLPYDFRRALIRTTFPRRFSEWQALRLNPSGVVNSATLQPFIDYKCIFVHIPKTAGIAVNTALFGTNTGHHRKIATYQAILNKQEYVSFFKFAFVRNPWDRLVSAYIFLKRGGLHEGDHQWAKKHLTPYPTFEDFVQEGLRKKNILSGTHFVPQVDFIRLPGKRTHELDFIGFFENLNEDYLYISQRLGVNQPLTSKNVTSREHKDYRSYYSDATSAIVAEVYRNDIKVLGYTFDNSSLKSQIERQKQ